MADVKTIQDKLSKHGYEILSVWTDQDVKRPYRKPKNRKHNKDIQDDMLRRATQADIFIMLDDEGLRGAYIELGAFLSDCLKRSKGRSAYIVGPDSHQRESIFESPEFIKFCDNIDEVYEDLKIAA